jgi:hypothetical protein
LSQQALCGVWTFQKKDLFQFPKEKQQNYLVQSSNITQCVYEMKPDTLAKIETRAKTTEKGDESICTRPNRDFILLFVPPDAQPTNKQPIRQRTMKARDLTTVKQTTRNASTKAWSLG